ncbi:MAG: dynamin family protein [Pseudomonadota bacterium]
MEASTSDTSTELDRRLHAITRACEMAYEATQSEAISSVRSGFKSLTHQLARPVQIAFFGETNVGKTTLANRILGAQVLPTSVVANTPYSVHVRHGQMPSVIVHTADGKSQRHAGGILPKSGTTPITKLEIVLPLPQLREIEVFDTPSADRQGPGAIPHSPRADIFVWCTNASRAWSASDRAARLKLPPIGRERALLVATNADTLGSEAAREAVRQRLQREADALFGAICFSGMAADSKQPDDQREPPALKRSEDDLSFEKTVFRSIRAFRERRQRTVRRLSDRLSRLAIAALIAEHPGAKQDAGPVGQLIAEIEAFSPVGTNQQ